MIYINNVSNIKCDLLQILFSFKIFRQCFKTRPKLSGYAHQHCYILGRTNNFNMTIDEWSETFKSLIYDPESVNDFINYLYEVIESNRTYVTYLSNNSIRFEKLSSLDLLCMVFLMIIKLFNCVNTEQTNSDDACRALLLGIEVVYCTILDQIVTIIKDRHLLIIPRNREMIVMLRFLIVTIDHSTVSELLTGTHMSKYISKYRCYEAISTLVRIISTVHYRILSDVTLIDINTIRDIYVRLSVFLFSNIKTPSHIRTSAINIIKSNSLESIISSNLIYRNAFVNWVVTSSDVSIFTLITFIINIDKTPTRWQFNRVEIVEFVASNLPELFDAFKSSLSDNNGFVQTNYELHIEFIRRFIIPTVNLLTKNIHILNNNAFSYIYNIVNFVSQLNSSELFRSVTDSTIVIECLIIIKNYIEEFRTDVIDMFKTLSRVTNRSIPLTEEICENLDELKIEYDTQEIRFIKIQPDTLSEMSFETIDPITNCFIASPYFFKMSNDAIQIVDRVTYYNSCRTGRNPFTNISFDNSELKAFNDNSEILVKRDQYMDSYNPLISL